MLLSQDHTVIMTQITTHAAANPRPNETQSMDDVSWLIAPAYSIQNAYASHPCWDERRYLPWFHPLDGSTGGIGMPPYEAITLAL